MSKTVPGPAGMKMTKSASGVTLPLNEKGIPALSGTAMAKFRDRNPSTIAYFAEFFGLTPQRYQRLMKTRDFSQQVDQPAVYFLLRLIMTKMPELFTPPPTVNPKEIFRRLQEFIDIDGRAFCLMIGVLPKSEKKILSDDYIEEEIARVRRGAKSLVNPSVQRLLYCLEQILDSCEAEKTDRYLDLYLDAIEEEMLSRGEDPEEYWSGRLQRRPKPVK